MDLLAGVRAREVSTDRIRMHLLEAGPDDGIPLVLVHGNLSTGRFYEHLMPGLAEAGYRVLAPDMRSFGRSEPGSGAAGANPEFVQRLRDGDRSADSPFSIRNVVRQTYWAPSYRLSPEREDVLVDEILLTVLGDGGYPGSAAASPHWPGFAPGDAGLLNAISPKHLRWDGVVGLASKPPVLWTHGTADLIVADGSMLEAGTLGQAGLIPGWPGEDAFPPQQMVTQIRDVLDRYAAAGGRVRTEMFDGSGHGPLFDAEARWVTVFRDFLESAR